MIKFLIKLLIVVVILLILIPLGLLLFGEGALAYKIFDWSCTNGGGSDYTLPSFNGSGRTITIENSGETYDITDEDLGNIESEVEDILRRVERNGDFSDEDFDRINNRGQKTGEAAVNVKAVHVDHDMKQNGKIGMLISVDFETKNLKKELLYCMVRFYNDNGAPLAQKKFHKQYRSVNGNVMVASPLSPESNNWKSRIELFMPYDELQLESGEGRTELLLDASVLHYTSETEYETLDRSRTYAFYVTSD